jgi:ATP-binding cassette, subfamily B, multidrug efflux pump
MEQAADNRRGTRYDIELLRWVWGFVRPYRHLFWLSVVLMPLNTAFSLTQPLVIKLAIDLFVARRKTLPPRWLHPLFAGSQGHGLAVITAIYAALLIGEFATFYGQFYLTMMVAQYSLSDLRQAQFSRISRLPLPFFDRTPVGRLVSRLTTDVDAINEMFSAGSLTAFNDALTLCAILAIMFHLNPGLTVWAMCAVPPLVLIVNFFTSRARIVFGEIRDRLAALNAYLAEAIGGMSVIQLFTREELSRREFDTLNRKSRDAQMRSNIYDAGLFSSIEVVSAITIAIIVWAGGGRVIRGMVSLGTLVAFFSLTQQFFGPLREASNKYTAMQAALAAAERIYAVMSEPLTISSPSSPRHVAHIRGEIVFDHVDFEYRPGEPVLRDVSFRVEPGQKVAIVGATGAGKTTVIKLLNRFYDVGAGRILVDGVDVREWDLTELRRAIGLVQQDVFLFSGGIADNVRLARTDLTENELRQTLDRAQALAFVERMPARLDEPISERGANLSAGQRQLLSFARVLAYNPRILVMDEATSSVDSETERLIQLALDELLKDRTALIIAHRLSTIERADRIMVMSNGTIRESGTHNELLAKRGLYYRLFELQYATATEIATEAAD